jgi:hydrocephalus-inducing protein
MKVVKFVQRETLKPDPVPVVVEKPAAPTPKRKTPATGKRAAKQEVVVEEAPSVVQIPVIETIRVVEVQDEPTYTVLTGRNRELPMKMSVVADNIRFSLDLPEIAFAPTMMYQTRVAECKVTNQSAIRFDYTWRVVKFAGLRTNYAQIRPPPFTVEPLSGFIEPAAATVFKVKFTPLEVDDFTAVLACDIPFLSQSEPPTLQVTGLSRRPLCHFNVESSDYISAGRRHPEYTYKLPDDIKVIELFARGIGAKSLKRFELINPTSTPYEIIWRYLGEGTTPITCETPHGLISSGKRSTVAFQYIPVSVKTIESLWEFQIPEHSVRVQFLFVGRIMIQ